MKQIIRRINEHVILYKNNKTGIAWIEDEKTGNEHSCHSNIYKSGSIKGMKKLGYWGKKDRVIESNGFKFNIDSFVIDNDSEYDVIVAKECMCEACIERRNKKEK